MRRARLLLVVLTLPLVALYLPPSPAGAAPTINTGDVTGGTMAVNLGAGFTIDLTGAKPPAPCAATLTPGFAIDITANATDWSTDAIVFLTAPDLSFTFGGVTYFLKFTKAAGASGGTIGAPPARTWTQATVLTADIYPETAPGNCTRAAAATCGPFTITAANLTGSLGAPGIGGQKIVANTVGTLGGAGNIAAPGCAGTPFAGLNGKVATFANMDIKF